MRAREPGFGHMAGDAIMPRDRAGAAGLGKSGKLTLSDMASQAFGVIPGRIRMNQMMRVVAGQAANAAVVRIPATAQSQPVGLKSHIQNTHDLQIEDHAGGAMAGAAEFDLAIGRKPAGIIYVQAGKISRPHGGHMRRARAMTFLAGHSRFCLIRIESAGQIAAGGVTDKTFPRLIGRKPAAQGSGERGGQGNVTHGGIEPGNARVIADAAFVIVIFFPVYVGLGFDVVTKSPEQLAGIG